MHTDEFGKLKAELRTNIERAAESSCPSSILLLIRDNRLPVARITDECGRVSTKVMSLVDLLASLDRSTVLTQLRRQGLHHTEFPELAPGTLLASVTERPDRTEFAITGYVEPQQYLFVLDEAGHTRTFEINLPHLVYRAVYNDEKNAVTALSLALARPGSGTPSADSYLLRWPFSNVYDSFGTVMAGVCWPGVSQIETELKDVPETVVKRFVTTPNNGDMYGRGLSHNAPYAGYGALLEAIESEGAMREDYLTPLGYTASQLHRQEPR